MNMCLLDLGHKVDFITKKWVYYADGYTTHALGANIKQMREAMKLYEPHVDLCHAHNEPSWYVALWKEISDKPVILDVHDSFLTRITSEEWEKQHTTEGGKRSIRVSSEERANFQMADGLVFPAKPFMDLISEEFRLEQPKLVLPSMVPERFYSYFPMEWHGGIVYEGKVSLENELGPFSYCDYREFARQANEAKLDFHIYPTFVNDALIKLYPKNLETTYFHTPVMLEELIKKLGRHDWGLVGNVTSSPQWEVALPNKLFEYMAAGLPIAVMNAQAAGEIVKEFGIGIEVESIQELCERWAEHRKCRENVYKFRKKFSMDANIHKLEAFYKEVLTSDRLKRAGVLERCKLEA
jgi:hypothetical protein